MDKGDRVVITKAGELRVIPQSAHEQAGDDGDDRLIGTVADVREPPDDSIIAIPAPERCP